MNLLEQCIDLATNPKHTRWLMPLLLAADSVLTILIIWKVPYTEIDWKAYMQQVEQYVQGERDYTAIKGDTGPLVYPAAHITIYTALYEITDHGKNIRLAQYIFAGLYTIALACVMVCYRNARAPPYIFPLLVISKRLHSVFVLRLFNDGITTAAMWMAIFAWQNQWWTPGCVIYSAGLGVKMNLLLVLPAVAVILCQAIGRDKALTQAFIMAQIQVFLAIPFLTKNWRGYVARAFDLTREFLFEWTVNWRFLGEDRFLSKEFTLFLGALHVALLSFFIATRWTQPLGPGIGNRLFRLLIEPRSEAAQKNISRRITPAFILATILSANTIGMLCARSLHYQFYAWLAWGTPFLLWWSGFPPVMQIGLWTAQEWAWNVYPSTNASSMTVVAVLAITVIGTWIGNGGDLLSPNVQKKSEHVM